MRRRTELSVVCLGNDKSAGGTGVWVVWDGMAKAQDPGMEKTH